MLVALGSSSRVLARAVPCSARLSTVVASEAAFGIDSFFTPIYPQDSFSLAQTDKKVFTEVFEMCKAATLGKKVPLKIIAIERKSLIYCCLLRHTREMQNRISLLLITCPA